MKIQEILSYDSPPYAYHGSSTNKWNLERNGIHTIWLARDSTKARSYMKSAVEEFGGEPMLVRYSLSILSRNGFKIQIQDTMPEDQTWTATGPIEKIKELGEIC